MDIDEDQSPARGVDRHNTVPTPRHHSATPALNDPTTTEEAEGRKRKEGGLTTTHADQGGAAVARPEGMDMDEQHGSGGGISGYEAFTTPVRHVKAPTPTSTPTSSQDQGPVNVHRALKGYMGKLVKKVDTLLDEEYRRGNDSLCTTLAFSNNRLPFQTRNDCMPGPNAKCLETFFTG
jgi:hypothetical protein